MVLSLADKKSASIPNRMMRWALEHPDEWDVVLGFANANAERILDIKVMLNESGFTELPELMAMRAYRLISQNGDGGS